MRKALLIILCLLMIVSLCGCSDKITEGEVYKKEYKEAYTTVMTYPMIISTGKTMTTIIVPYTVYYPERYVIRIKAFVDDEWVKEDFYVSKEVYDAINIGDMFEYSSERGDLADEPYTKERIENDGT